MARRNAAEESDPLVLFAEKHGGYLKPIPRAKRGMSYVYYFYDGAGNREGKYFPAGTPPEHITQFIIAKQGNRFSVKHGYDPLFLIEDRKKNKFPFHEMLDWYIAVRLQEKVPLNHPLREDRLESARITLANYERAHKLLAEWLGQNKGGESWPAESISRNDLDEFQRWLAHRDGGRGGNRRSTVIMLLSLLRSMFRKAVYEGKLTKTPFDGFEMPRREKQASRREVLTLEEMKMIGDAILARKQYSLWWAWTIARLTGIRGQDIRRLKWENFDWEKLEYDIYMVKVGRRVRVPFHPVLRFYCEQYFAAIGEAMTTGKIFSYQNETLSKYFRSAIRAVKGASKQARGTHTPRHSLATYLDQEAKWPLDYVGTFLCHDSGNITLRYTHARLERLREMIAELPFK